MTLIIKPQILYAPMLSSFGGGSARGFNPGGGGVEAAEVLFTTWGSHSWTVPDGVTSVCVVCVGGGGAGMRDSAPGNNSSDGQDSYFVNTSTVAGLGGGGGTKDWTNQSPDTLMSNGKGVGGGYVGDGGGNGGSSRVPNTDKYTGFYSGGGAGGYSGNGGDAGKSDGYGNGVIASGAGSGGGGSGGSWIGGGGVGIYGQGSSGAGDSTSSPSYTYIGKGGSGGGNGGQTIPGVTNTATDYMGGIYGGGAGGTYSVNGGGGGLGWKNNIAVTPGASISVFVANAAAPNIVNNNAGNGGPGVVRVLWGSGRAFPSTSVALADSTAGQTIV